MFSGVSKEISGMKWVNQIPINAQKDESFSLKI